MFILFATSTLSITALLTYLAKRISTSTEKLAETMELLGEGKLDKEVEDQGESHEIGIMANATEKFRLALIEKRENEKEIQKQTELRIKAEQAQKEEKEKQIEKDIEERKRIEKQQQQQTEKAERKRLRDQSFIEKIDAVLQSAKTGDLSQRIRTANMDGSLKLAANGFNDLIAIVETTLTDIKKSLNDIAEGKLSTHIDNTYQGVFGELIHGLNATSKQLHSVVAQLMDSYSAIMDYNKQIAMGNEKLSTRSESQAASLEETVSNIAELYSTFQESSDISKQAKSAAKLATDVAIKGEQAVNKTILAMAEINESSKRISDITNTIDSISFQTNLLSLNAAVEAAHAGEQGRGFAIVALEIRNLAQRSATSAKEIKDLIEERVEKVAMGSALANESGDTLNNIQEEIISVSTLIDDIATRAEEQTHALKQINSSIGHIHQLTQQNATLAIQTTDLSRESEQNAIEFKQTMDYFKT